MSPIIGAKEVSQSTTHKQHFIAPVDKETQTFNTHCYSGVSFVKYNHKNQLVYYRYTNLTVKDFQQLFNNANEYDVLSNYHLYAFKNFHAFAQTLPSYSDFICALHNEIKNNKQARQNTGCIPGFEYQFGLHGEKSGFHDFISEQTYIHGNKPVMERLQREWSYRHAYADDYTKKFLTNRIKATQKTTLQQGRCHDYSSNTPKLKIKKDEYKNLFKNMWGTALDCQLHTELCEIRNRAYQLGHQYNNSHAQTLEIIIHTHAAQAKQEKCLMTAFELADICHALTTILSQGMKTLCHTSRSIGSGINKGFGSFISLDHWKNIILGPLEMGIQYLSFHTHMQNTLDSIDNALLSDLFYNTKELNTFEKKLHLQAKIQIKAFQETYKTLNQLSWQQIIENASEIGTSIILDTVTLNALANIGNITQTRFFKNLVSCTENGALFAPEYAVEAAGVSKLIIEEGEVLTSKIMETMKNNSSIPKNKPSLKTKSTQTSSNSPIIPATKVPIESQQGIIRNDLRATIQQYEAHIFSDDHVSNGIMALGKNKPEIMDALNDIITLLDKKGFIKEGPNQIRGSINGINTVEIRCFIQDGEAISLNAYLSDFGRIFSNFLDATKVL